MFHAAAPAAGAMFGWRPRSWAKTGTKGGAQEAEEILVDAGAHDWAAARPQLRRRADKTEPRSRCILGQMLGFMSDPALAAGRHRRTRTTWVPGHLPAPVHEPCTDRRPGSNEKATAGAPVRRDGQRDPLHGRPDRPARRQAGGWTRRCCSPSTRSCRSARVPLPSLLADSGGKGIQIIPVVHGEAQLRTRWKRDGAQAILDTCGVRSAAGDHRPDHTQDGLGSGRQGGLQGAGPGAPHAARGDDART